MTKTTLSALAAIIALTVLLAPGSSLAGDSVRIGLVTDRTEATLGTSGPGLLTDSSGNLLASLGAQLTLTVGSPGLIYVPGAGAFPGPLVASASSGYVTVADHPYRGDLEVFVRGGLLTVVNRIPLEDYLLGVVPREMPAHFPQEALKAQAVATRTYALYAKRGGAYASQGYDLVPTTASQVYGGIEAESEPTTQAVRDTAGEVVTYDGRLIGAFFHSTSGGHTESVEFVWGFPAPYLKGVPDVDTASPHHTWSLSLASSSVAAKLEAAGYGVGEVLSLQGVAPEGPGGRSLEQLVVGRTGQVRLRSEKLRSVLGLRSTKFEVKGEQARMDNVTRPLEASGAVVVGAEGRTTQLPAAGIVVQGASGATTALTSLGPELCVIAPTLVPATFTFDGHGWGHGVGMSQWGARGLALQGKTYREILTYYYTGVTVGTLP